MNSEPTPSTNRLLLEIWNHLNRRRRLQLSVLFLLMLISGLAELLSLGSVLPFLAVLSNPEQLWLQPSIQSLAVQAGFSEASQLVLPAALVFALAAVLSALIRLANLWFNGRLAAAVGSDLSCEAYRRTLYQPYHVHVQRNSSLVIAAMTQHISVTVAALNEVLQIMTSIVVVVGLLCGLLLVDWQVAFFAVMIFGLVYGLIAIFTRHKLTLNGRRVAVANNKRVQAIQEGLGAIRDVILDGSHDYYVGTYGSSDRPQRLLESQNKFLSLFPRYALEAIGLVVIALLGAFLVMQRGSGALIIPVLGALALGAQRLLPALQQVYTGWANLKSWSSSLASVAQMLAQPLSQYQSSVDPLLLKSSIRMQDIRFQYTSTLPEVLRGIDLEIRFGERIGLIGSTGSGKSTLIDVLMGLLTPTSGQLLLDDVNIHCPDHPQLLGAWRAAVAHVPQNIYLSDASIAENIAFGMPKHLIDMNLVKEAAEKSQIAGFIESMPNGYNSFVGERGVRLSGGQQQRIGIARALYKNARVIVLDEATSALDSKTEMAVMDAVEGLSRDLTIVMIAHRLGTVQRCDRVVELSAGAVVASGPPSQFL